MSALVLLGQTFGFGIALIAPAGSPFGTRAVLAVCCIAIPILLLSAARIRLANVSMRWRIGVSLASAAAVVLLTVGLGRLTPWWSLEEQHRTVTSGILLLMYLAVVPLASVLGSFLGTYMFGAGPGLDDDPMQRASAAGAMDARR